MSGAFNQAEIYENNSSIQKEDGQGIIKQMTPEKGDKILDLGCGTGYFSKVLADIVGPEGKVIAIDPNLERLQLAKEKYPAGNLEYRQGTAENIPGTDYDIIFSNYVIHWCKDKDQVFHQVSQSLKKGGKFAFVVVLNSKISTGPAEFFSPEFRRMYIERLPTCSVGDYLKTASAHNFKMVYSKEGEYKDTFKDASVFIEFYKTHTNGEFGDEHFNINAIKDHHGEGEIPYSVPTFHCILIKEE